MRWVKISRSTFRWLNYKASKHMTITMPMKPGFISRFVVLGTVGVVLAISSPPGAHAEGFEFGSGVQITNGMAQVVFIQTRARFSAIPGFPVGLFEVRVRYTDGTIKRTSELYAIQRAIGFITNSVGKIVFQRSSRGNEAHTCSVPSPGGPGGEGRVRACLI